MAEQLTVGGLLQWAFDVAGVRAIYGRALPGVRVTLVYPPRVAGLMADADRRLRGGWAAVHEGDGRFVLRGDSVPVEVDSVDALVELPRALAAGETVQLRLDPRDHVPRGTVPVAPPVRDQWVAPSDELVERLRSAERPLLIAGPGVVQGEAVPGLQAFAAAAHVGVLNSWGAKGIYDWRSRHHLATVGLQERDAELSGLADADLVAITGQDHGELTGPGWDVDREIEPGALPALAAQCARPLRDIPMPALRTALAEVTQAGWVRDAAPLAPTRVTKHYGEIVAAGGVVAADPGTAGYWVARTVATTRPRAVHVPARRDAAGFAVACVTVARLLQPGRPALAVVDDADDEQVRDALAVAESLGVPVPVEAWVGDGRRLDAAAHADRLWQLTTAPATRAVTVATDASQLDAMVAAAGPVTAWR